MDELSPPIHDPPHGRAARARYRVPVGLPPRDDGRRAGALVSLAIHAAIITLLVVPFFLPAGTIERMQQGAGGAGPAGGGGGGSRGTGGERTVETLRFVKVMSTPVATPSTIPPIAPAVPPVVPPVVPEVKPPKPAETPPPQVQAPASPAPAASAPVSGSGGGGGTDGSAGAGPGSGGGVGAGVGAGRGSGEGPGTGGGARTSYDPKTIALFIPPLPPPASVRGMKFTAEFDVDSTGRVLDFRFTETPDRGYNRQLANVLRAVRFRPGTRPDGTPIRMKTTLGFDF
jgi:protein TonB